MKSIKTKLVLIILSLLLAINGNTQNGTVVKLENGETLTGNLKEDIVLKGFDKVSLLIGQETKVIYLRHIHWMHTSDAIYRKKKIRYKSLSTDILIKSFVKADVNLYEGFQIDGEKMFFIERPEDDSPRYIPIKGIKQFLNFYFKDCSSWKELEKNIGYNKKELVDIVQENPLLPAVKLYKVQAQQSSINLCININRL